MSRAAMPFEPPALRATRRRLTVHPAVVRPLRSELAVLFTLAGCSDMSFFGVDAPTVGLDPGHDEPDVAPVCEVYLPAGEALEREPTCAPVDEPWSGLVGERVELPEVLDGLALVAIASPALTDRVILYESGGDGTGGWFLGGDEVRATLDYTTGVSTFILGKTPYALGSGAFTDDESTGTSRARLVRLDTWTSLEMGPFDSVGGGPATADIDGDGEPELITSGAIFRTDGQLAASLPQDLHDYSWSSNIDSPAVADLDLDGLPEALTRGGVYHWQEQILTPWPWAWTGRVDLAPAVVRGGDGQAVVLLRADRKLAAVSTDAELLWTADLGGMGQAVNVAAADVDGDGEAEICARTDDALMLLDIEGNVRWTRPTDWRVNEGVPFDDSLGLCVFADLDGDAEYEVVDLGPDGLAVVDADGSTLAEASDLVATLDTMTAALMVLDLDGDGAAEIIVEGRTPDTAGSMRLTSALWIYHPAVGRFPPTRPVWHQRGYDITSVADDGSLVPFPIPNWTTYNAFRAQPAHAGLRPDLVPRLVDACVDQCTDAEGMARVSVQIDNLGSGDAPVGSVIALYTDVHGGMQRVAEAVYDREIPALTRTDAFVIEVPANLLGTRRMLQVDDLRPELECIHTNDRVEFGLGICET